MDVKLIDKTEIKIRRGDRRRKGARYGRYRTSIKSILPWLKKQIEESESGDIVVDPVEVGKDMGSDFDNLGAKTLFWGLKFALYFEGIECYLSTGRRCEIYITMRFARSDYQLPPSLRKYIKEGDDIIEKQKKKATTPVNN